MGSGEVVAYSIDYVMDYTGGENSTAYADQLLPNQVSLMENADPLPGGGFKQRAGDTVYTNTATGSPLIDYFEYSFVSPDGTPTTYDMGVTRDGKLIIVSFDNYLVTNALGNPCEFSYVIYKNILYFISGGKYYQYDGLRFELAEVANAAGDNNLVKIAKCKQIRQLGNRLFAAGNRSEPNTLYYSEVGDPTYWKTTNALNVIQDSGDIITALFEYHGAMLVFKKNSIYAWFGVDPTSDAVFQKLNVHTGTVAPKSICNVEGKLFFLGMDGVYALNGTYKDVIVTEKISKNIVPRVDNALNNATISGDKRKTISAVYWKGKYILTAFVDSAGTYPDGALVFHKTLADTNGTGESWSIYTNFFVSSFLKATNGSLRYGMWLSSDIMTVDESAPAAVMSQIEVHVVLRPLHQQQPVFNKKYRYGYVWMKQIEGAPNNATLKCTVDYKDITQGISAKESLFWDTDPTSEDTTYPKWDTALWDFTELVTRRIAIKEKGKRLILDISNSDDGNNLVFYGFGVEYKIKK
jgi:hypothetical protein